LFTPQEGKETVTAFSLFLFSFSHSLKSLKSLLPTSVKYGYYFAVTFFMLGWSLSGKNIFNIWPNIIGVILFSRIKGKPLGDLIPPLLFGTSMAPVVSVFTFYCGLPLPVGLSLGVGVGICLGFCLASIMEHMLALHRGFTLYNIGTAAGFLGLVLCMIMEGFEVDFYDQVEWCTTSSLPLITFLYINAASLIILGFLVGGRGQHELAIMRTTGKLPCDFVEITNLGGALINMGIMCAIGTTYAGFVSSNINGPVCCGIFGMCGFGAQGKHPRNTLPIIAGVAGMALLGDLGVFYWKINSPTAMMAATFCTSLAPVSGVFGAGFGVLVGALHLAMASHIASVHGWMVLYNNGFAGGLVMTFVVGVINGLKPEMLETVAPVTQVAPNWAKNVADAYQSFQVESVRGGLPGSFYGPNASDDDAPISVSMRDRLGSHYGSFAPPAFAARASLSHSRLDMK
jgi:hypothetical protein